MARGDSGFGVSWPDSQSGASQSGADGARSAPVSVSYRSAALFDSITYQGEPAVTRETIYLVQAFQAGRGTKLNADATIRCKSAEGARKSAEGLALTRAGVVAFSTSGDAELGEYD